MPFLYFIASNFLCNNPVTLFSVVAGFFFKENVRYPVWTCRDPVCLILGTRFSLVLGTR